ncbi:hemerythrin [Sphaerisporangium rufum]|uniref:Hemerythrin n=1 Tax=Sphaerisporangium rufum TaxID=1381558 RepID=A0A919UZ27_9ACTN|nr:hemerythrin domain-containing protein [Sphaerisporangium rufum]GII75807.1 hemerythrin [Sphaerisporangium rufum]
MNHRPAASEPYDEADGHDVVGLLRRRHAQIAALFDQVAAATGIRREQAFHRLVRLIATHETAEEQVVHPYARLVLPGGDAVVDRLLAEERELKILLAEVEAVGPDGPGFEPELRALRAAALAHIDAEERDELGPLGERTNAAERRTLAVAVRAAETFAPTHPHPGLESATLSLLLGPPAALSDRARDLVNRVTGSAG